MEKTFHYRTSIHNPTHNARCLVQHGTTYAALGSPHGFVSYCKTYPRRAVTAEAAGSSPVVLAILSKRLTTNFERMAWCTTKYTAGCICLTAALLPFQAIAFPQLSAALDVLVCHGVRVDVHGAVAIDHITHPRRLGGLSEV